MWLGKSEQNVHEVFERARRNAPCVLFIDELDALGQKRSHLHHSGVRGVVVQLLTELDGFDGEQNEGVFVLGATNQPWDVDPALRRPGRFDRTILVVPPDPAARAKILALQLADRPTDGIDVEAVAKRTGGYSGADLQLVCETATEFAIEASLRDGRTRPISQDDLVRAIGITRPSTRVVRPGAQLRHVRQLRRRVRRAARVHEGAAPAVTDESELALARGRRAPRGRAPRRGDPDPRRRRGAVARQRRRPAGPRPRPPAGGAEVRRGSRRSRGRSSSIRSGPSRTSSARRSP